MKKKTSFIFMIIFLISFVKTGYVDEISISKERLQENLLKIREQFKKDPNEAMANIATLVFMYRAYDEGLAEFKRILKENSDNKEIAVRAHSYIVSMYMGRGEYAEAINEADIIIKNYPESDKAFFSKLNIAECYEKLLKWDKAELRYKAIIQELETKTGEIGDTFWRGIVYQKLGRVLFNKNKYEDSIENFNKGFKLLEGKEKDLFPQTLDILAESQYLLGEGYLKTGKIKEANQAFQMVIEKYPASEWKEKAEQKLE